MGTNLDSLKLLHEQRRQERRRGLSANAKEMGLLAQLSPETIEDVQIEESGQPYTIFQPGYDDPDMMDDGWVL